jgi:3-oxoacyl-[acyl-carrier protein] reductase
MASQHQGTIVNVSSLMGKVAAPTMATYSATKFAILGFTQALRQELAEHNIRVVALLPTLTDTDMTRGLELFRGVIPMTPERVAQIFVAGLKQNQTEILVGWQSHLAIWCQRLMPGLLEMILRLAMPRKQRSGFNSLQNLLAKIYHWGDVFALRNTLAFGSTRKS